jgi:hypothetical protein
MLHTCLRCSNNKYINMKLFACVLLPTSVLEVSKCEPGFKKIILFFSLCFSHLEAVSHMSLI